MSDTQPTTVWAVMLARPTQNYDLQAVCTSREDAERIAAGLRDSGLYGTRLWIPLSTGRHWMAMSFDGAPVFLRLSEERTNEIRDSVDENVLRAEVERILNGGGLTPDHADIPRGRDVQ